MLRRDIKEMFPVRFVQTKLPSCSFLVLWKVLRAERHRGKIYPPHTGLSFHFYKNEQYTSWWLVFISLLFNETVSMQQSMDEETIQRFFQGLHFVTRLSCTTHTKQLSHWLHRTTTQDIYQFPINWLGRGRPFFLKTPSLQMNYFQISPQSMFDGFLATFRCQIVALQINYTHTLIDEATLQLAE